MMGYDEEKYDDATIKNENINDGLVLGYGDENQTQPAEEIATEPLKEETAKPVEEAPAEPEIPEKPVYAKRLDVSEEKTEPVKVKCVILFIKIEKMKHAIKVIAFDADDTLWSNEPFFQEVERKYTDLLSEYGSTEEISAELFKTEMGNLECLGYGAKAFTISMVETALRVSGQKISAEKIQQIILLGKSLLQMPIELLPSVEETLKALKEQGDYRLVVATKGDLLDQERKLQRSGLMPYFDHIEIMSDKTEKEYTRLLQVLQVAPEEFLMIGNSLKSDIKPVLAIGGYGVYIPFEVMWQHEVVDTFNHPRLKQMKNPMELLGWL